MRINLIITKKKQNSKAQQKQKTVKKNYIHPAVQKVVSE